MSQNPSICRTSGSIGQVPVVNGQNEYFWARCENVLNNPLRGECMTWGDYLGTEMEGSSERTTKWVAEEGHKSNVMASHRFTWL